MALTAIDVQQKKFGTALRGYDLDEVDDFLDEVVTSLKAHEQRLAEAQERIAVLEQDLSGRDDSESAISRALVAAQRSADMIVDEAKTDAARILSEAEAQNDRLSAIRDEERAKLSLEISSLKAGVSEIRDKVRALATSLESDLDEMDRVVAEAEAEVETPGVADNAPIVVPAPAPDPDPDPTADTLDHVLAEATFQDESLFSGPAAAVVTVDADSQDEADHDEAGYDDADHDEADDDEAAADEADETGDTVGDREAPVIGDETLERQAGGDIDAAVDEGWMSADDEPGDAWEQEGLDGWDGEDDDRPRRPWE